MRYAGRKSASSTLRTRTGSSEPPGEIPLFRGSASLCLPSHILDPRALLPRSHSRQTRLAQHLQRVIGLRKIRVVAHGLSAEPTCDPIIKAELAGLVRGH
jgi:hypothetical protein